MRTRLTFVLISALVSAPAWAQDDTTPDHGSLELEPTEEITPEEARAVEDLEPKTKAVTGLAPKTSPGRARADRLAGEAEQAFVDGDYPLAITLLQQAYDADRNPNMLYNIARVHEAQGQLEEALDFYRRFVVAPNVDLDYRREALQSSETIEQTLAAKAAAERGPELAAAPPQTAVLLRPAPFPTTSAMRPLGYTLAAVGGAAVLVGAGVGVAALNKQSEFDAAGSLAERRSAGSSARDLATAADALYISGAVLIVTGVITAFASPRRERLQPRQAVDVTIRSDGVGAAWSLRF